MEGEEQAKHSEDEVTLVEKRATTENGSEGENAKLGGQNGGESVERKPEATGTESGDRDREGRGRDRDRDRDRDRRDRKDRGSDKDKAKEKDGDKKDRDRDRRKRSRSRDRSDRDRDRERRRSRRSRSRDKDRERKKRSRSRDRERRRDKKSRSRSKSPRDKDDDRKRRKSGWDSVAPTLLGSPAVIAPTPTPTGDGPSLPSLAPLPQLTPGIVSPLQLQQAFLQQQQLALKVVASAPGNQQLACRIYVGSLNFELSEEDIKAAFSPFGPIRSLSLTKDPITQRSKGFAFIEYAYPDAATAALKHMNGFVLSGRQLKVGRPHNAIGLAGAGMPGIPQVIMPGMPGMSGMSPLSSLSSPSLPVMNPAFLLQANAAIEAHKAAAAAASGSQPTPEMMQEFANLTGKTAGDATASNRIYVGSIHWDLTAEDIKTVFEAFGTVKSCVLMPNPETGKHKGYGFVEYDDSKAAEEAIQQMNGWDLGGRPIRVGRAISSAPILPTPGAGLLNPAGLPSPLLGGLAMPHMPHMGMSGMGGMGGMGGMSLPGMGGAGGMAHTLSSASAIAQAIAAKKTEESLSHEENLTLSTPNQRYALMQKLARGSTGGKTSRCMVLKNMVGPDDVDDELEGEITDEATKYGIVERVVIYQERQSDKPGDVVVKIFILFQSADQAQKSLTAFNGRWFGGRQIKAGFYDEKKFLAEDYSHD